MLLLPDRGQEVGVVAHLVGCVRATVYRCLYRFEDLGEDALLDQRLLAPPRKVPPEAEQRLLDYLPRSPRDLGWQRSTWTLELLALQLARDLAIKLSPRHVRNVLRAQHCRRGRPRPALRIPVRGRRRVLDQIDRLVKRVGPTAEVLYVDEADIDLNRRIRLM